MKTNKNLLLLLSVLSMAFVFSGTTLKAETESEGLDDEPILVGRISHVEGGLLRYHTGDEGWTPTVDDAPFGAGESLYAEGNARLEIILPNGTWARFDGGTQVQLIELREDLTDLDLSSGTGRFYSNGAYPLIKVRTIFGDVTAQGDTAFDLHVYGNALEVIALKGSVSFWRRNTDQRFEVKAGLGSIVADAHAVSVGTGYGPPGWAAWNRDRDALWAARMTSGEVSAAYLPPSLRHEAHALDANGVWEKAYYDSGYYYFWRPTHVPAGWSPFTVGCWNTWHHESTWVPYEPFGYVTHHYGNWVFIGHFWYWAPPVANVRPHVGRPLFNIGFAWYPGRVAWLSSGTNVGWVPLAPHEPYYAHRRWGHKAVVARDVNLTDLNVNVTRYRNHRHAVVIERKDLHKVRNYRELRITSVDRASAVMNYLVVTTPGRIPTRPVVDSRDARNPASAAPRPKSHVISAEKNVRLEGGPGGKAQPAKIRETPSSERPHTAKKRPQTQMRSAGDGVTEPTRPIAIRSSPPKQARTIDAVSKRAEASVTPVKKQEARESIAPSQPAAKKADPRRAAPGLSSATGWPMVERALTKRTDQARMGSRYRSAPTKLKTDEGQAKSKPTFSGAKEGASDNGKRTEPRQQTRETRVITPFHASKGGNDPKASLGTGRIQPSSRGSMDRISRGSFRN